MFEQYVIRKYGRTIVVFDGYSDNPSTKDCAYIRISGGTIGVTVHFISRMALQTKREEFLSNKHNKQRFIAFFVSEAGTSRVRDTPGKRRNRRSHYANSINISS